MTFGNREPRELVIGEMALTCLIASRDLGNDTMVTISARVIAQLRTGQTPKLGDVRAISMTMREMFR